MLFSRTKLLLFGAALGAAALAPQSSSANRLLTENFEYEAGNLCGQGKWYYLGTQAESPVQLTSGALTYDGYQATGTGLGAQLTHSTNQDQDLATTWDTPVTSGTLYASVLLNVTEVTDPVYFFSFGGAGTAGYTQGKTISWEGARVFACPGDTEGRYQIGFSKNGASPAFKTADLPLGQTVLVVIGLEIVDGTSNDVVSLWVNPVTGGETAPAADSELTSGADQNATRGVGAVQLRQGSTTSKTGPIVKADALRVADTWADLWDNGGGTDPDPGPDPGSATLTVAESVNFGLLLQYASTTKKLNVKAEGLTEDIAVSSSTTDVKPSVTTIPKDEAMSEAGYTLTLDYKATSATLDGTLTLSTAGSEPAKVALTATVQPVTPFANFRQIGNLDPSAIYLFQGKATVTYVDAANSTVYAQDIYGGGAMFDLSLVDGTPPLKKGDRFTNVYCFAGESQQGITPLYYYPAAGTPTVTATDVEIEPLEVSLAELTRAPDDYTMRLVKVLDVDFGTAAGQTFSTSGVAVTTADGSGRVRAFGSTDLIGTEIPAKATSVTGISTSANAAVVTMRSTADLVAAQEPAEEAKLEVTTEMLIDANEYQEVGKPVAFGKITVTYNGLTAPAQLWIGGKDRSMFSLDKSELPAGNGTEVITVVYTPTTTGRHSAMVNIDATPTTLSESISLSARAYNPAVAPEISVDASGLTDFTADVNGTQTQTLTYTTANLLDYGNIRVAGTANGAFRISSTSMLMNGQGTLTVTFNPKAEGTYTEQIIFSADKATPVTVTVTGSTTGATPQPPTTEGDELTMESFDTSNAHALLIEDFQHCGTSNKPLSLEGWTNAAITGTRAWWAYKELDSDNFAAKVTAYDSKATETTEASMLLMTPALDYVNAKQQLLTFRVMGKLMRDDMYDNLQVIYIDPTTQETTALDATPASTGSALDNVWTSVIEGLGLPASADYNDQWLDYVVDLKGLELADKFFIAFGFTSLRGTETTVQYLIDDFSWGRDDIRFIRPAERYVDMTATIGADNTSAPIEVEGLNLSGAITLDVQGANASKFSVEPNTLPAAGGSFTIHFSSDEPGIHSAYVSLKSEGAPESLVMVEANNSTTGAISDIFDETAEEPVDVYNLQGIRLMHNVAPSEAIRSLQPGLYIIGGKKVNVR